MKENETNLSTPNAIDLDFFLLTATLEGALQLDARPVSVALDRLPYGSDILLTSGNFMRLPRRQHSATSTIV